MVSGMHSTSLFTSSLVNYLDWFLGFYNRGVFNPSLFNGCCTKLRTHECQVVALSTSTYQPICRNWLISSDCHILANFPLATMVWGYHFAENLLHLFACDSGDTLSVVNVRTGVISITSSLRYLRVESCAGFRSAGRSGNAGKAGTRANRWKDHFG